jgi:crotonobetainyl-CoA:carnitine CoA-transferase CaiB-like acyl-CoA transferase
MSVPISDAQPSRPLDGIRVVEYATFHAGPGGNAILGDLGADVIKIERSSADPLRFWTRVAGLDFRMPNDQGIVFEAANRSKRGICLDITSEKGRGVFERLLAEADVFLTNLRGPTREKLGIDYAAVRRIHPGIIYASVSGYGPQGPMKHAGGYDPLGQAISGMAYVTGTRTPELMHLGLLDQAAAITVSHAIITALLARERQGISQQVHVSLYGTALWLQYINLLMSATLGADPCVSEDRTHHSPLRNTFCCRDGKWILGAHHPEEKYWTDFCEVTGQTDLLSDPRFTSAAGAPRDFAALNQIFDRVFATRTRDRWVALLQKRGLMFCPVQHISEVPDDPQAVENRYCVPFSHPVLGEVPLPGYPIHFSAQTAGTTAAAPQIGEHTDEILSGLGYSAAEIASLRESGAIK